VNAIIPDPDQPERLALDGDGNLLGGVFIRRLDSPEAPTAADLNGPEWTHVGWSRGVETHESRPQPEG
jgi:hypothetical protein